MRINTIIILLAAFLACQTMAAQSSLSMPGKQKPATGQTVNSPKQKQKQKQKPATSTAPKQKPLTGTINGHEWVDLGLPSGLKWATCNVGASSPEQYGDYFAWGETKTKSYYSENNCPLNDKNESWLHANGFIDSKGNLTKSNDAAYLNWGGTWRIPSEEELNELMAYTTSEWDKIKGVKGVRITSKCNGASIFVPATGSINGSTNDENGKGGEYRTATFSSWSDTGVAYSFYLVRESEISHANKLSPGYCYMYMGLPIRPVSN